MRRDSQNHSYISFSNEYKLKSSKVCLPPEIRSTIILLVIASEASRRQRVRVERDELRERQVERGSGRWY